MEVEVHTRVAEVRVVETLKGVEAVGVAFCAAVASDELPVEVDADLRNAWRPILVVCYGQFKTCHEVLLSVGAELSDRKLRAGEDYWLREVLQHERNGRGGIGHGVGTVEDYEPVIIVVAVGDYSYQLCPEPGAHVGGVYDRIELICLYRSRQ